MKNTWGIVSLDDFQKRLVSVSPFGISILGNLFPQCFSCVNCVFLCSNTAITSPSISFLTRKRVGKYSKPKSAVTDKSTF